MKYKGGNNKTNMNILFVILIILLIVGLIILYNQYKYKFEKFSNKQITIQYYYMDGCCHCDDFSETWTEFTSKIDSTKFKTEKLNLKDVKDNKYKVTGTPTIIFIKEDDTYEEFNMSRTLNNLVEFANKIYN